jgi:hypothetical protein
MTDHNSINEKICNRALAPGYSDNTYYTLDLYNFACDNYDDPLVLFKIKVYGYYAKTYRWTKEQADLFIEKNAQEAEYHSDGSNIYYYDWGKGDNQITDNMMHEPNLDHIDPVSLSRNNDPDNFRIRCARLNENKGNMVSDYERRATILDMLADMRDDMRYDLVEYIVQIYKIDS